MKKKESKETKYIRKRLKEMREEVKEKRPKPIGKIGVVALKNKFDRHCVHVLSKCGFLDQILVDREYGKRRPAATFEILKPLPTMEEYAKMRDATYTQTIQSLIESAFDEADCLKEELEEWHGNLPDAFQNGEKGEQLQAAIDQFDYANRPELPEEKDKEFEEVHKLLQKGVVFLPSETSSRSDRLGECCRMLEKAAEELPEDKDGSDIDTIKTELQSAIDEWNNVDFPGMY